MEAKDYLKDLSDIRDMMSRSTQFISLSGLSGVLAGFYALVGAYAAKRAIAEMAATHTHRWDTLTFILLGIAAATAVLSVLTALVLTYTKAARTGETIWNPVSRRLIVNFMIPLTTGGAFVLQLVTSGDYNLVGPSMLIFYGLSCVNASKYTFRDVRWLGVTILLIGLIAVSYPVYTLEFMAVGFGLTHILYGLLMYVRYDRK